MQIGTYYYPEQWPRSQWQRDFDHIAAMGLQIVHMAEFAWFDLEPRAGEFQFDWLGQCIDMARQRNLGVILCTPTAAPPIWLSQRHPETLPVRRDGSRARFGGRRHYNPLSPVFRDAAAGIVSAMADRFGDHPAIIGWQIDNEYSLFFDQSETTHAAFRQWLRHKYGDIAALNRAWGNPFWNTYYTDFDQILFPPDRDPRYANPHQCLDASRFWSWAFAQFNKLQVDILKPKIGRRFITTNFMPMHLDCDPGDMAEDLTLLAWDSYPVTGMEKQVKDQTYRIADPAAIGLMHDQMASYHHRWGLLELQPGQLNWSGVPAQVYPGAVRLWLWTAFAHGAEFVTTYRFRQPRFGIELFHGGLVLPDGVTPSPGGRQFAQVIQEIRRLDLSRVPHLSRESHDPRRTVGLVFDFDQLWYYETMPQAKRWNQPRWLQMWYAALCRLGVRVLVLRPGMAWPDDLPLVVAPGVQMVDDALMAQMDSYARGGGNLVLTCRSGLMDRTGQLWESPLGGPILPLIGATIDSYDGLPEGVEGRIKMNRRHYAWNVWADQLTPQKGAQVLATYADQPYAGAAAITRRVLGKGSVHYFGVYSHQGLLDAFVESLSKFIGPNRLRTKPLPPRVQLLRRGPYHIALNYQHRPMRTPAPAKARFLIGSVRLAPADVAVWEE
ncbi:MAG: beta-galactosidase [Tepidisphaeraceae bacterium]|jgi:beta-galactosidase